MEGEHWLGGSDKKFKEQRQSVNHCSHVVDENKVCKDRKVWKDTMNGGVS